MQTYVIVSYFLQEAFSDVALFFHDVYGGDMIGVVWKPHSFVPAQFKVQSPFCVPVSHCCSVLCPFLFRV